MNTREAALVHSAAAALGAVAFELATRLFAWREEAALSAGAGLLLLGAQVLMQLACGCLWTAFQALHARSAGRRWVLGVGIAVPSLAGLLLAAGALTRGGWIAAQPFVWAVRWLLPALLALLLAYGLSRLVLAMADDAPSRPLAIAAGLGALLLAWMNVDILPGLYPTAHLSLWFAASMLAQWAGYVALRRRASARWIRLSPLAGAVALVACVSAAMRPSPQLVAQLILRSDRTAYWLGSVTTVRVAPIFDLLAYLPAATRPSTPARAASSLRVPSDWNVVLIVVDALRADALQPALGSHPARRFAASDAPVMNRLVEKSFRFERAYGGGNVTILSMPSMFTSRWPTHEAQARGRPLGVLMSELGRLPVAVVPILFLPHIHVAELHAMTEGFAHVATYEENAQDQMRPLVDAALERAAGQPFFAWFHYYAVHDPGWAGKPLPTGKNWPKSYVRALRWTDREVGYLLKRLSQLGIADKTLVVLTSDHGEALGDVGKQLFHAGPSVDEELVRVPLSLYIPGKKGKLVKATVGNVDIVPTLVELLGGEVDPHADGTSLGPLLQRKSNAWDRAYYFQSLGDKRVGLVRGADKLVWDRSTKLHVSFDLDHDPWEERPLSEATSAKHGQLLAALTSLHPDLVASDLERADVDALLDKSLRQVGPDHPGFGLLLDLVHLDPTPARLAWAHAAFEKASDDAVRAAIARKVFQAAPARMEQLLAARLERLAGSQLEAAFVAALAAAGLPRFAPAAVASHLARVAARRDDPSELPFLQLISNWELPCSAFAPPLAQLASRHAADSELRPLLSVLRATAHLEGCQGLPPAHESALRALLSHAEVQVRAAAARALGRSGSPATAEVLRERYAAEPLAVKLQMASALVDLLGEDAIPDLSAWGREPGMTIHVIELLATLASPRGLEFLDWALTQPLGAGLRNARHAREAVLRNTKGTP